VLAESLIRLGRPFTEGGLAAEVMLLKATDLTDDRARNFFRHVFVVEIADSGGQRRIHAHPYVAWGHQETLNRKEVFRPDTSRIPGIPFTVPRGNPRQRQGRYPVPVYLVYDEDFNAFAESANNVEKFLTGRLEWTLEAKLSEHEVQEIAEALSARFGSCQRQGREKRLGIIVLADTSYPNSPYTYAATHKPGQCVLTESKLAPGKQLVANLDRLMELVWKAKAEEGAKGGGRIQAGECSVCREKTDVVSLYSQAWPWFSVTWTGPLPMPLGASKPPKLVEGVALCPSCYGALTFGAQVFSSLSQPLPNWVTKELFSPSSSPMGKDRARRGSPPDTVYGGVIVLPVLDGFLEQRKEREDFVAGILRMQGEPGNKQTVRHLATITGFEFVLPEDFQQDIYRLTLLYYSGNPGRGDIHLRATIEDVYPSVATEVDDILQQVAQEAAELRERWRSAPISEFDRQRYSTLPYLLVTAYGAGYLWQALADVLHRRPLSVERFVRNVTYRLQELSHHLPDSLGQIREEVRFYVAFSTFLREFHTRLAIKEDGGMSMRPWQEIQRFLTETPVAELTFDNVDELGFACGHLTRQFSRQYWSHTKTGDQGKDFLTHRVMSFGSSLTPHTLWRRALSRFDEYALKLKMNLPQDFRRRNAVVLMEYARMEEEVKKQQDRFMAAFWAGYALQDLAS